MLSVKFEISSSSDLKWVCITSMVKNTEETPIASIKFKNTAEKEKNPHVTKIYERLLFEILHRKTRTQKICLPKNKFYIRTKI